MIFYGIYKITNLVNGKMYIGKHQTDNIDDNYFGSGKILKYALQKYGKHNFRREWIMFCENAEEMDMAERMFVDETWILRSDTYNLCKGGEGGHTWSGCHPMLGKKHTESARKKISLSSSGEKNHNFGKKVSVETRNKISKARTGQPSKFKGKKNPKISMALTGHLVSKECRWKISAANKGKQAWNKSRCDPVLQLSKDGKVIREWSSKFEAKSSLKLFHLEKVLRGERQTAGGFKWKYKQGENA